MQLQTVVVISSIYLKWRHDAGLPPLAADDTDAAYPLHVIDQVVESLDSPAGDAPAPPSFAASIYWFSTAKIVHLLRSMGVKPHHTQQILTALFAEITTSVSSSSSSPCPPSSASAFSPFGSELPCPSSSGQLTVGASPSPSDSCASFPAVSLLDTRCLPQSRFDSCLQRTLASTRYYASSFSHELFWATNAVLTRQYSLIVLLAGTSGTGKSTLASLVADRLGASQVLSTDSVRNVLRQQISRLDHPEFHVSTYEAAHALIPSSDVSSTAASRSPSHHTQRRQKKKQRKQPNKPNQQQNMGWREKEKRPRQQQYSKQPLTLSSSTATSTVAFMSTSTSTSASSFPSSAPSSPNSIATPNSTSTSTFAPIPAPILGSMPAPTPSPSPPPLGRRRPPASSQVRRGYRAQCALLEPALETVIAQTIARGDSLVLEGVHLSMRFIARVLRRHSSPSAVIVPFLVAISNGDKHRERLASRSRMPSADPAANKYLAHFAQIRVLQRHMVRGAKRRHVPPVDNTNVDRSVATLHSVILRVLHRAYMNEVTIHSSSSSSSGPSLLSHLPPLPPPDPAAAAVAAAVAASAVTRTAVAVMEEYQAALGYAWSATAMRSVIESKVQQQQKELQQQQQQQQEKQQQDGSVSHVEDIHQADLHGGGDEESKDALASTSASFSSSSSPSSSSASSSVTLAGEKALLVDVDVTDNTHNSSSSSSSSSSSVGGHCPALFQARERHKLAKLNKDKKNNIVSVWDGFGDTDDDDDEDDTDDYEEDASDRSDSDISEYDHPN